MEIFQCKWAYVDFTQSRVLSRFWTPEYILDYKTLYKQIAQGRSCIPAGELYRNKTYTLIISHKLSIWSIPIRCTPFWSLHMPWEVWIASPFQILGSDSSQDEDLWSFFKYLTLAPDHWGYPHYCGRKAGGDCRHWTISHFEHSAELLICFQEREVAALK